MIWLIATAALDAPLALALKFGIISSILGGVVAALGGLTRNQKLLVIGIRIGFVGVILWGIVMLYFFLWIFLH